MITIKYIATNTSAYTTVTWVAVAVAAAAATIGVAVNSIHLFYSSFSIHHLRKNTFQLNFAKVKLFIQMCMLQPYSTITSYTK